MALSKPKAKYVRETRASLVESMVGEYERYQELLENNVKYQTWKEDSVYVKFKFKYGYYNRADDRRYRDDTVYYSSSNFEKAKGFALKFYDKVFSDSYYVYFRNYSFSGVFPYNETREEKIERKTMINKEELNVREGYKPNIEWIKINPFFTSSRLLLETKGFRVWNVQTQI